MSGVKGAAPAGAVDAASSQRAVRQIFEDIAPRYDLLNRLLSLNVAALWWRRAARTFREELARPEARILDFCCGTGSMTEALLHHRPADGEPIVALDFSPNMLAQGTRVFSRPGVRAVEGDAMHLPFGDNSLDLATTAFGFRNLPDYDAALREAHRVLKPGGRLGILECNEPSGLLGRGYDVYFHHVLPRIGAAISGAGEAYRYLPQSVARFPQPPELLARARAAGFSRAQWTSYTFGIAGLYVLVK